MGNPNDNKKKVIMESIKNNTSNIDHIGQNCKRKRKRKNDNENDKNFLQNFKMLLIYEAICAFMYYLDTNNGSKYLIDYSPRLYEISEAKRYISLIDFN